MDWLVALLTWLSADPGVLEREAPRAAAAVEVAYASMPRPTKVVKAGGDKCVNGCPPTNAKTK